MMPALFQDRFQAGRELARALRPQEPGSLVLALPRGGVPVGFEIAVALQLPLDVFVVRKLGVPGHEELAMGAIASGGIRVIDHDLLRSLHIPDSAVEAACDREIAEILRRERQYSVFPPHPIAGHPVILTDDGLATGSTMLAAIQAVRQLRPATILVAVPVAAHETCSLFQAAGIPTLCLHTPEPFRAVGLWYEDFSQTSDEEVRSLLTRAARIHCHPRG